MTSLSALLALYLVFLVNRDEILACESHWMPAPTGLSKAPTCWNNETEYNSNKTLSVHVVHRYFVVFSQDCENAIFMGDEDKARDILERLEHEVELEAGAVKEIGWLVGMAHLSGWCSATNVKVSGVGARLGLEGLVINLDLKEGGPM